ncbi:MAG: hypothetical protein ACRDQ4_17795 [Pseudonocardiaceae bacterium]
MNQLREDMMREFVQLTTCEDGNCPGFSRWTDTGDFRVQGYRVAQADKPADLPGEEDILTIPHDVMLTLLAQLLAQLAV